MHDDQTSVLSRRHVVRGVGAGLAMAASPVLAQDAHQSGGGRGAAGAAEIQDPRSKYPKAPFRPQPQPWPGLARDMDPKPDHGKTSYRGSGRLSGRKALITGGDSGMARAAAIAYAREGADVAINCFPAKSPDAQEVIALIRQAGRKGIAIPGDLRDEAFCQRLVPDAVQGLGGLDVVLCNAGPAASEAVHPRHRDRGFRRDDEDEHLRPVLDH
jgi:short chain dehydrogenase